MSEISDKANRKIRTIIAESKTGPHLARYYTKKILDIPEIAIVDRNAELRVAPPDLRDALLKKGWVKEVKNNG